MENQERKKSSGVRLGIISKSARLSIIRMNRPRANGHNRATDYKHRMCNDCLVGLHDCQKEDCPCVCNEPDFPLNKRNGINSLTTR